MRVYSGKLVFSISFTLDNHLFLFILFIYFILVFVGIILLLSIVAAQKKNSKTGSKGNKKQESRSTKEPMSKSPVKVRQKVRTIRFQMYLLGI